MTFEWKNSSDENASSFQLDTGRFVLLQIHASSSSISFKLDQQKKNEEMMRMITEITKGWWGQADKQNQGRFYSGRIILSDILIQVIYLNTKTIFLNFVITFSLPVLLTICQHHLGTKLKRYNCNLKFAKTLFDQVLNKTRKTLCNG